MIIWACGPGQGTAVHEPLAPDAPRKSLYFCTDVKELVPEFYYMPEFLSHVNGDDLGTRQARRWGCWGRDGGCKAGPMQTGSTGRCTADPVWACTWPVSCRKLHTEWRSRPAQSPKHPRLFHAGWRSVGRRAAATLGAGIADDVCACHAGSSGKRARVRPPPSLDRSGVWLQAAWCVGHAIVFGREPGMGKG